MKEGGMNIIDCNNHVKTATNYFGPSCAVNCLSDKYNPIGDNSDKLCKLCIGKIPGGRCTDSDPYAGYEGAFKCLLEVGEIAFLKHNTVPELVAQMEFAGLTLDGFELLCKDGTRRPVKDYLSCHWGRVPSNAVVTSSAVSFEDRTLFQKFLQKFSERYGKRAANGTLLLPNSQPTNQPDQFGNARQPIQYDQFGNPRQPQYDQFGNPQQNPDFSQPQYDQYGNRINRYKRQNFGNFGTQDRQNSRNNPYGQDDNIYRQDNDNPYRSDNNNPSPYRPDNNQNPYNRPDNDNPYRSDNNNQNPYRSDNDSPYRPDNESPYRPENDNPYKQDSNNPNNPNNDNPYSQNNDRNRNNYDPNRNNNDRDNNRQNDPFARDPYSFNPDKYGQNIDPYNTDIPKYNQDNDRIFPFNNFDQPLYNGTNGTFYEVFSLFDSAPKYGIRANLIFQDSARAIAPVSENLQTYTNFLGESLKTIMGVRDCPVGRMTLCITSDAENNKCVKMRVSTPKIKQIISNLHYYFLL